jgi:hypothetical protein
MSKASLKDLHRLPVEIIQDFRKTGKSLAIPGYIQDYILQLDRAVEIHNAEHEHNVSRAAMRLMESFPNISLNTARARIFDAINYFHLNNTVKAEAWDNYYADRLEDLAQFAISKNNITEARRSMEKAREYRKEAAGNILNGEELKPHVILISPEVNPELLGLKDFNLKQLWKETQDFIEELPIDKMDKRNVMQDAAQNLNQIEDIDYEDVE